MGSTTISPALGSTSKKTNGNGNTRNRLLRLAPFVVSALLLTQAPATHAASTQPLLTIGQVEYVGGFRIPSAIFGSSSANYSYGAIGYNPDRKSLFVAGTERDAAIAEFSIPQLVKSTRLSDLNMAPAPLQNFADVLHKSAIDWGQGLRINGLFYANKKLLVNIYRFYDQSPFLQTPTMILDNADDIRNSTTRGYISMAGGSKAAGWVSPIPFELQSALGGTHMGGFSASTARALVYNTSEGPSAFSFNPLTAMANSTTTTNIPSNELMSFTLNQPGLVTSAQLYNPDLTNKLWTFISEASFGMVVPGTRSYLVLGGSGGHNSGVAYGDPPYGGYKAYYSIDQYDNSAYYWLFDVNDFERVRLGQMAASAVKPYAYGVFNAPFSSSTGNAVAGGTYDPASGTMYLSIFRADNQQGAGNNPPVIVAFKFNVAGTIAPKAPIGLTIN